MSNRESYMPGSAAGAEVVKDGDKWTLVLVRDLQKNDRSRARKDEQGIEGKGEPPAAVPPFFRWWQIPHQRAESIPI